MQVTPRLPRTMPMSDSRCGSTDVRNQSDLSDYEGSLLASTTLRVTDQANGVTGDQPGTIQDVPFEFGVPCAATAAVATGGDCSVNDDRGRGHAGIATEGSRAVWARSQRQVLDAGHAPFARQGVSSLSGEAVYRD